ncbi:MAG: EAL domain-containing protein [Pseudomonadales bacterium]|nr:EAL domain-containing protein [Pseudomonadales bacterium]
MTLKRQLFILLTLLLLLLLMGIFAVTVNHARDYLQQQMHVHAQDTSTSLGLSIAPALGAKDIAMVETMVDAIFDRGYYRELTLRGPQGELLVSRHLSPPPRRVPQWFINWLSIEPVPGVSEVSHDWQIIGKLRIMSDRDQAYRQLWRSASQTFFIFLAVGVIAWVALVFILRSVFRPLEELEHQAEAICQKDFSVQQPLPKTRELRRVVQAMNRMTRQLKVLFDEQVVQIEQVRNQAYVDSVSGLGNGRFFSAQLDARVHSTEEPFNGALARVQVSGLLEYNEEFGKTAGDELLKAVGKQWRLAMEDVEGHCVARVSGARFAALLPNIEIDAAKKKVRDSLRRICELPVFQSGGTSLSVSVGMSFCNIGGDPRLLEVQANSALTEARQQGGDLFVVFDEATHGDPLSPKLSQVDDWEAHLKSIINQKQVTFEFQPILSCVDQSVMHYEALARIEVKGEMLNAGLFLPLVERYGLEESFDQMIVRAVIETLETQAVSERRPIAVNIAPHSIRSDDFIDWLITKVGHHGSVSGLLIFEVPEVAVRLSHGKLRRLADGLKAAGAKLSIDHFGTTNSSFGYLSGLPLYSIKVDQSYIRDIRDNLDNQFFVQSLVRIAHSRNILLTAEMVEQEVQWNLLRSFQLDGAQGYYLGKPTKSLQAA